MALGLFGCTPKPHEPFLPRVPNKMNIRRHRRSLIIYLLLVLLIGWLAKMVSNALIVWNDLGTIQNLSEQPFEKIEFKEVQETIEHTQRHIGELRHSSAPLLMISHRFEWLPRYGPDIAAANDLIDLADSLITAANEITKALEPLAQQTDSAHNLNDLIVQLPLNGDSHLEAATNALRQAKILQAQLDTKDLSSSLRSLLIQLDNYLVLLNSVVTLTETLPNLVGIEKPQTFLILIQNQDELRPTGGFIGGAGLLKFKNGAVNEIHFVDSLNIDDLTKGPFPLPPETLQQYMGLGLWLFRDANWSPDFPTSAKDAIDLYHLSHEDRLDGVIALDQTAVKLILEAIGPLEIAGIPDRIDSGNFISVMRKAWSIKSGESYNPEWIAQRKDFMIILAPILIERVMSVHDKAKVIALAGAVLTALRQHHILIYSVFPPIEKNLAEAGFNGSIHPGGNDFLMVVDANVGFNRANSLVQESIYYAVDFSNPTLPLASLSVKYFHGSSLNVACRQSSYIESGQYSDYMNQCYWDYWRILVPQDTTLLTSWSSQIVNAELITGYPGENSITQELRKTERLLVNTRQQTSNRCILMGR